VTVQLIIVPYYLGHYNAGMGAGPTHLLDRGIDVRLRQEGHDVVVSTVEYDGRADHEIGAAFRVNVFLADHVRRSLAAGRFPIVLAGNCNSCLGTIGGLSRDDLAVVWLDAHGDFHSPDTTQSGFVDGFPLNMAVGRTWKALLSSIPGFKPVPEQRVVLAGTRDLDPGEDAAVHESAMHHCDLSALRADSMSALANSLDAVGAGDAYLHVDLDALDTGDSPANEYSPQGGLSAEEFARVLTMVGDRLSVRAAALTCYNPGIDRREAAADTAMDAIARIAAMGDPPA
jgi:arginase